MIKFADFQFDQDACSLTKQDLPVALEPQALQLLGFLIRHRDRIVSKDDLIEEIWGGRAITDAALNTRIRAVRKALGDTASSSDFIKTFPKRGFQFVAKVSTDKVSEPSSRRVLIAGVVGAIALFFVTFMVLNKPAVIETGQPSIAVLPFENLNDEGSAQYFVSGLTDTLTAQLSRNRELFVVSRATMISYAHEDKSPVEIARELGVRYVVRGSVWRGTDQVRVSGELIDVDASETIWAETFDRKMDAIFVLQDEISQSIAGQLLPQIYQADVERIGQIPTKDLQAWDLYLRGRARQFEYTQDAQTEAADLAQQAIARDPEFASAHSLLARALGTMFFYQWSDDPQDTLVSATQAASRAIELDDQDPQAHAALGYLYRFTGDADRAIANLERAVFLNPNDARIRLEMAHTLDWFRMHGPALPQIEMALRLSPRDPLLQNMHFYNGHILFHLKRHEDALKAARQLGAVATSNTWRVFHYLLRAANLAELGRDKEAQAAIDAALAINPNLSVSAMRRQFAGSKNHPENRRIWLDSLRSAGLPE